MIPALLTLLTAQLLGEGISRALSLPLPGPVLGLLILLAGFALFPKLVEIIRLTAQGILGNLMLLFVPAGVGVVGHLDTLAQSGLPVMLALLISSPLAIAAGALTFTAITRLTGKPQE